MISNRNDNSFGPGNDSIAIFSLVEQSQTPAVSFLGLYPSFGSFPRQFDISSNDGMMAIAQQSSHKVVVTKWDMKDGTLGSVIIEKPIDGEIPAVIWHS